MRVIKLLFAISVLLTPRLVQAASPAIESVIISRPEGKRHVLLYAPVAAGDEAHPFVILLHGHGGTAAQLLGQEHSAAPLSVWLSIAAREKLIVAAPDGAKGADGKPGWNDGRADARNNPQTDDVGLIAALIDREVAAHHADPARVFVMGMSNGGMMTLRLAVELGPRLAGVAAVSASIAEQTNIPAPSHPLSVMIIAGTADPLVPYKGGDVHFYRNSRGAVIGVEDAIALWRKMDALDGAPPQTVNLSHRLVDDPTRATREVWGHDAHGLQVELLRIYQGGHVEPSMTQRYRPIYTRIVGHQNGDCEAAEEAWSFFRDKRRDGNPAADEKRRTENPQGG